MLFLINNYVLKPLSVFLTSLFFFYTFSPLVHASVKKVAIIVPLEHEAMNYIVAGIKEALSDQSVDIIIKNAQGDTNILLSLINQLKNQSIDIILPIGTMASQMTLAHIETIPVVCVAALIDPKNRPLMTGINDEVPISTILNKLPTLQKIAVFYSASEKIFPEIEALKAYALTAGISLHLGMIHTLLDLSSATLNAPADTQAFLILKDHLLVSGLTILKKEAFKRSIPIIACDEGSVSKGATFGIGVTEKQIGSKAGLMAKNILQGTNPKDILYQNIDSLQLFINEQSFSKQTILHKKDLESIGLATITFPKKK